MAITWGEVVGGYGKIGYEVTQTISATKVTTTVKIYFASKYSVTDTANTLYYDKTTAASSAKTSQGAMSIKTTVNTGSGWSSSNQVHLKTFTHSNEAKTKSRQTRYFYAKLANVDRVGGTMYVSGTYIIPALAKYTISYNVNGGSSDAPASQTKYYGENITLSGTKPTRIGHSFLGWATSASGSVAYPAGATYSGNANLSLYAKWQASTCTVRYDANGGSGAPASQTKTYGTTLTLSRTKPTRTNYNFLGWATTKTSTSAMYSAGGSYTTEAGATLYAVWELAYKPPSISKFKAVRCDSSGNEDESGTYALITCDWECFYSTGAVLTLTISTVSSDDQTTNHNISGTSGSFSYEASGLSVDTSYTIKITIDDDTGSTVATITLPGTIFPWDALAGGNGIAFGKSAEQEGVAEFAFDAQFNRTVSGNVMGLNKLPPIPINSDLNNYKSTGSYACYKNDTAETIVNIPVTVAGRLEVCSPTGEGIPDEGTSYIRQKYYPYNKINAVWERDIVRDESNEWTYHDWWRSSLTPTVSSRIYEKAVRTIVLEGNTRVSATGTYVTVPFGRMPTAISMGRNSKLSFNSTYITIGAGVDYVRVSGQALVSSGSTAGVRHLRIQRVSGSLATSIAWTSNYSIGSSRMTYCIAPIVISVSEGDQIKMVYHTTDAADTYQAGSSGNGYSTYLTVETM